MRHRPRLRDRVWRYTGVDNPSPRLAADSLEGFLDESPFRPCSGDRVACRASGSRRAQRTGRFERTLSALTAAGAVVTAGEIYLSHDGASVGNKMMWWPVVVVPAAIPAGIAAGIAAVFSRRAAHTELRAVLRDRPDQDLQAWLVDSDGQHAAAHLGRARHRPGPLGCAASRVHARLCPLATSEVVGPRLDRTNWVIEGFTRQLVGAVLSAAAPEDERERRDRR
jgi:hypothetical protein